MALRPKPGMAEATRAAAETAAGVPDPWGTAEPPQPVEPRRRPRRPRWARQPDEDGRDGEDRAARGWFARKLRRSWGWFVLAGLLVAGYFAWFVPNYGWGGNLFATIGSLAAQLLFAAFFLIVQFAALFWFLGRARVYWLGPGETGVSFKDYRGNREVLELAERVVILLRGVKKFKHMGGEAPKGVLLVGPPGTGKSYLAQAIATEAHVPFCYASAPSFQNMFFGVGNLRVMMIYAAARKKAREFGAAIVFIDEIDAIGASRAAGGNGVGTAGMLGGLFGGGMGLLNELLLQMDPPNVEHGWLPRLLRALGLRRGRAKTDPVLTIGASVTGDTPIVVRKDGMVRRLTIGEFVDSFYRDDAAEGEVAVAGWQTLGYRGLANGRFGGREDPNYFGQAAFVTLKGVFRHRVDHIFEIDYLGGSIRATGDHSVFVRSAGRHGRIAAKRVDQLKPGDILVNLPCKVDRGANSRSADRAHAFPGAPASLPLAPFRSLRDRGRDDGHAAPEHVALTPAFHRLIGYFLAVGFAGRSQIDFCLNRREQALAADIRALMAECFGCPRLRERTVGQAHHLTFSSAQVAHFLRQHVGADAHSKRLPAFLWQSDRASFIEFLRGYAAGGHAAGDGSENRRGDLTLVTVNRELAVDLNWLCRMHGMKTALGSYAVPARKIAPDGGTVAATRAYRLKIGMRSNPLAEKPFPFTYVEQPVVRAVRLVPFDGYVYDLCGCENEAFFGGESPVLLHNTNLPEVLDPALLRPGRFDHKITVDAPDMDGRKDVLEYYLAKVAHDPDFPVDRAAADTIGYTPAMIRHVVNEGVVYAHFAGRERVGYEDFTRAREGYEWGLRQPIRTMSAEDRRRLAYHEAGHAVAQYLLLPSDRMIKVTIVRHGQALGLAATKPIEERYTRSRDEIFAEIQCALASRAAEELFLGVKLSGVVQDLTDATRLAAAAIGWLGMDGSLYSARAFGETVPDPQTKRRIERILDEQLTAVKRLLATHRTFVQEVAAGLLDRHELSGDEVDAIAARLGIRPGMGSAAAAAVAGAAPTPGALDPRTVGSGAAPPGMMKPDGRGTDAEVAGQGPPADAG
jgi:ATP-dependent Zn protease